MNNLITFIARATDSMMLVATMDHAFELEEYKSHAKKIIKNLKDSSPSKCTIEAGPYLYHYIIENHVCYLVLCEKAYPKRLAFQYMDELCKAFYQEYGQEIVRFSRPYAAVEFDPLMSRIRKEFLDPRSPKNVQKINNDLNDIHNIMCQNIQEVLHRGEKLDVMQNRSQSLLSESKRFDKQAKYANLIAKYRAMAPLVAVVLVVLFVLWWRFF
jgi:vesicle transport protein SEC22